MKWDYDTPPKDGRRIIIAVRGCDLVTLSRWLPPKNKVRKIGRWERLATNETPLAWRPWPTHPEETL